MPEPVFSARHVKTIADLPGKLVIGRAYFVGDESYIIIDHGNGPVIYGAKTGPQGIPGEPLPQLQDQIDKLTQASIFNSWNIQTFNEDRKSDISAVNKNRLNDLAAIYEQFQNLSKSVISLAAVLSDTCDNLRTTENTLLKIILETDTVNNVTPFSADEVLETEGGSWKILESSGAGTEGTLILTKI